MISHNNSEHIRKNFGCQLTVQQQSQPELRHTNLENHLT